MARRIITKPNPHLDPEKCRARGFQKGQVSNPKGREPVIKEVKELAKQQTELAIGTLVAIMSNEKTNGSARVQAAVALLDRGWGRPKQSMDIKVDHDASGLAAALDALRDRDRQAVAITGPVIDVDAVEVTVLEADETTPIRSKK